MRFEKYLFPTINNSGDSKIFVNDIKSLILNYNSVYLVFPSNDYKHHITLKLIDISGQQIPYKKILVRFIDSILTVPIRIVKHLYTHNVFHHHLSIDIQEASLYYIGDICDLKNMI